MAELELVTLHEDAERLVLRDPDGVEHTLAISEALRAAVRRDRPRTEALQAAVEAPLRPREIQSRLRAGATAEDLAAESGLPLEHVRRYEWPVAAERDHVVARVRDHRVDTEKEVTLGELADARLAARGVDTQEASWSARRDGNAPWRVSVHFSAGGRERDAEWSFDPKGRVVTALDDEARWLGQPDDPVSPEILGVPSRLESGRAPVPEPHPAQDATAALLDDLAGRRGQRPQRSRPERGPQDDELPLGLQSPPVPAPAEAAGASVVDLGARRNAQRTGPDANASAGSPGDAPAAVPSHRGKDSDGGDAAEAEGSPSDAPAREAAEAEASGPEAPRPVAAETESSAADATDTPSTPPGPVPAPQGRSTDEAAPTSDAGPVPTAGSAPRPGPAARRNARKGRAQMPSWDEIVFGGARPSS